MSDTHTPSADAHGEEHIHMPPPSFSPFLIALGLTGIAFGIVLTPIMLVLGIIIFGVGFVMSMIEEFRNAH
ncbi:MAG TPA: hypothetical protein PLJ62_03995 [Thermoflexales bacterium]|nr:hypothetical protein [Thermoflexales bacterium]HQW35653.1 hypothetical protein [Thermoflexales bacterium]HQX75255.1 hypothetical protein [Thermoflexales bacterium]HQZ21226.1 hypothetical protein [Thermoflexales bacterium]HQZ99340.1 hypothetical protein [Thermoflexales bacterium]